MRSVCLAICVVLSLGALAACGPKIPTHSGYKTKTPWKKAKPISLENNAGKAKGTLDYAAAKRAKWYTLDLPENGDLNLQLDFTPVDDAGDATVALEVLDHNYKVISEDEDAPLVAAKDDDDDDGEDDGEDEEEDDEEEDDDDDGGDESDSTQKTRALDSLAPGRYYIHLFVTKRLDVAEYKLTLSFTPMPAVVVTDYPKNVAWVPSLPQVPVADDAPATKPTEDKPKPKCKGSKCKKPKDEPKDEPKEEPKSTGKVSADVIAASANAGGGTDIMINKGTDDGLDKGRSGSLGGVKNGGFTLSSCGARTCKASVKATVTEVKGSSMSVTIK